LIWGLLGVSKSERWVQIARSDLRKMVILDKSYSMEPLQLHGTDDLSNQCLSLIRKRDSLLTSKSIFLVFSFVIRNKKFYMIIVISRLVVEIDNCIFIFYFNTLPCKNREEIFDKKIGFFVHFEIQGPIYGE